MSKESNQQILEQAISRAIDGGFYSFANDAFGKITIDDVLLRFNKNGQGLEWTIKGHEDDWSSVEALIFSHDFAKALWPGEPMGSGVVDPRATSPSTARPLLPLWKRKLMEMVTAENPIEYLGDNLPD